nr:reverse transcriptase domain-containing protein [Tanacetum cinerariifolium]
TERALIDVYKGEWTLRVGKEAVTFNLDQTSRYFANYDAMSVNRIDLIDVACEEYSQEVLGFSVNGNPTPSPKPIVSTSSPTLTPFEDSDFILEETDAFLAIDDEIISPKIDEAYYDSEGDILLFEEFLNDVHHHHLSFRNTSKLLNLQMKNPLFMNHPWSNLRNLKDEEKTALIKVLKSHKQALAWQLSDIKGINLEFYTHKILIEDDFKPAVQHQIRVNAKMHEVIKKEVVKLLDARLIYPISDSPWGIDFMALLPSSRGNKYILVVVDYLSKWVEVKALPITDARVVCKILKSLFARFGTPHDIISDLGENCASWSDKLDDALWAFRLTFKTPIGCTPYKLVYRKACHLPIKLEHKAYWALKHCSYNLLTASDHHKFQFNELNELRD